MFKQICFFRKRPDMTFDEFMDYHENQHSKLGEQDGEIVSAIPNAQRYVRRYLQKEINPVTFEVQDPGYDCIMEIWWNSRKDFEESRRIIQDSERLKILKEDERQHFDTHANPVCSVIEYDSPVGPDAKLPRVRLEFD